MINKSVNNQFKSNKESTINDDNQVHPNIECNTDPKTDKMIQDTENSDKSIILNSKSPKGNSSYLQLNKSTDNENTEVQTGSCGKSVIFSHLVGFHSSRQNIY